MPKNNTAAFQCTQFKLNNIFLVNSFVLLVPPVFFVFRQPCTKCIAHHRTHSSSNIQHAIPTDLLRTSHFTFKSIMCNVLVHGSSRFISRSSPQKRTLVFRVDSIPFFSPLSFPFSALVRSELCVHFYLRSCCNDRNEFPIVFQIRREHVCN